MLALTLLALFLARALLALVKPRSPRTPTAQQQPRNADEWATFWEARRAAREEHVEARMAESAAEMRADLAALNQHLTTHYTLRPYYKDALAQLETALSAREADGRDDDAWRAYLYASWDLAAMFEHRPVERRRWWQRLRLLIDLATLLLLLLAAWPVPQSPPPPPSNASCPVVPLTVDVVARLGRVLPRCVDAAPDDAHCVVTRLWQPLPPPREESERVVFVDAECALYFTSAVWGVVTDDDGGTQRAVIRRVVRERDALREFARVGEERGIDCVCAAELGLDAGLVALQYERPFAVGRGWLLLRDPLLEEGEEVTFSEAPLHALNLTRLVTFTTQAPKDVFILQCLATTTRLSLRLDAAARRCITSCSPPRPVAV